MTPWLPLPQFISRLIEVFIIIARGKGELVPVLGSTAVATAETRYLEMYLQNGRLVPELLIGKRGRNGGYRLARPPGEITLGDIYRAGEPYRRQDWTTMAGVMEPHIGKAIAPALRLIGRRMMAELDAVTLADLLEIVERDDGGTDATGRAAKNRAAVG